MSVVVFFGFYIKLFTTSAIFGFGGGEEDSFFSCFEASYTLFPYLALLAKIHDVIVVISRNLFDNYIRNNSLA